MIDEEVESRERVQKLNAVAEFELRKFAAGYEEVDRGLREAQKAQMEFFIRCRFSILANSLCASCAFLWLRRIVL